MGSVIVMSGGEYDKGGMKMLDRVEIKQDYGKDGIIIGVKVNGQEVKRVRSVQVECDAESLPLVTLEVYADVDIDINAETLVLRPPKISL